MASNDDPELRDKPAKVNGKANCIKLEKRYSALKGGTERCNWEAHCEEIAPLVSPRKAGFTGERTRGEKKLSQCYDATAIHANEMLASGLHGMATNPASRWFTLKMVDDKVNDIDEIKAYLSDSEETIYSKIYSPGSNWNTAIHEAYMDLGAFGMAVIFVGTRDDGGLLFQCRNLSECVVAENEEGVIDTVFRRSKYTVRQMVDMWGLDKVSELVRDKYRAEKYDDERDVIHAVYPREEMEYGKRDRENMPFASVYFEHEGKHLLDEGGFEEFPYMCPRWSKLPGEVYGRGPGMTALPDVKMLQAMMLTYIKALQKNADPPLWTRDDGILGGIRTVPGGVNYVRGDARAAVQMMPTSIAGLQAVNEAIQQLRDRIRTLFYTDVMQFGHDRNDMTATEVQIRNIEKMRMMGPLIGRLESELLGPMIGRVFGLLGRFGYLPEPPQVDLPDQQREWIVEFVSPIATAQRQTQLEGVQQAIGGIMMLGEDAATQIIMRKLNPDRLFEWIWDLLNNDPDLLNTDEELAQKDQMEKAQQAMAMAQPGMDMANQGAGTIKQLSEAAATQGMDVQKLLQGAQQGVSNNPQAQDAIQQLMQQAGINAPGQ